MFRNLYQHVPMQERWTYKTSRRNKGELEYLVKRNGITVAVLGRSKHGYAKGAWIWCGMWKGVVDGIPITDGGTVATPELAMNGARDVFRKVEREHPHVLRRWELI